MQQQQGYRVYIEPIQNAAPMLVQRLTPTQRSGRVLDSRLRVQASPASLGCVLEQDTLILAYAPPLNCSLVFKKKVSMDTWNHYNLVTLTRFSRSLFLKLCLMLAKIYTQRQ